MTKNKNEYFTIFHRKRNSKMGWPYECKYCGSKKDSFMCMKSGYWFCSGNPCKDSYWFAKNGYHWCEICEQMEKWKRAEFYDVNRQMWLCSEKCAEIYDSLEPDRQYWRGSKRNRCNDSQ